MVYGEITLFGDCFKMPNGTQGQKKLEGEMKQNHPNAVCGEPDGGHGVYYGILHTLTKA